MILGPNSELERINKYFTSNWIGKNRKMLLSSRELKDVANIGLL